MSKSNRTVLIISPESWGKSKVSKHHYALAFAKKGFNVLFLNIDVGATDKDDKVCDENKNIKLTYLTISPFINKLRFHFRPAYNALLAFRIKAWVKKHPNLDYLISFDCNGVFTNLSHFRAKKTIFFPVDQINANYRKEYKGFDALISISPVILRAVPDVKEPKLLHHGLSPFFVEKKYGYIAVTKPQKIAYVGNLLIGPILDKVALKSIISTHKDLEFHFYGAVEPKNSNLGANLSEETLELISYLKANDNCVLHGIVSPQELADAYEYMDAFLVIYNYKYDKNECSNSHKIMEYLSTGKPIISTRISMYDDLDLFPMLDTFDNTLFPSFFADQLLDWESISNPEIFEKRIDFAQHNTYDNKVVDLINSLK